MSTSIMGRVWLDSNGNGSADQAAIAMANVPVFIQRLDQPATDVTMTLVVYTDEVGGYSLTGLDAGTYQIWTETNRDNVFFLVVTIDEVTPTVIVDLPAPAYRIFISTVMR